MPVIRELLRNQSQAGLQICSRKYLLWLSGKGYIPLQYLSSVVQTEKKSATEIGVQTKSNRAENNFLRSGEIWRRSEYQDEDAAKFTAPGADSNSLSLGKLDTVLITSAYCPSILAHTTLYESNMLVFKTLKLA